MLKRMNKTSVASASVGINGTRISSTFDGKCVKTMVRTSPKRAAKRAASSAESPASRLAPKKIAPSVAGFAPKRR